MKNRYATLLIALVTITSLLLAACAPTATQAPAATQPPAATQAPAATQPPAATQAPAATQPSEATTAPVAAADCAKVYGTDDKTAWGEMAAIEAVDPLTVKFTLCYPDPAFRAKIAFSAFAIHPKEWIDKNKGAGDMLRQPIGTGPYMLKEWVAGDHITLEANPNYWGEAPKVKTVIFRWNAEAAARLLALQAGEVDGIDNPDPNDFETVEGDANLKLYPRPALNVFYIGMNNTKPPLDNEKVRQAIYMAIDKQTIVNDYYPKGSIVATQFCPPALKPCFTDNFEDWPYDPEQAKALLQEANVGDITLTLNYRDVVRGYLPLPGKVAEEIQAQLADVGITVNIEVMESGAFLDAASTGQTAFFLLGWGADYPDATNFLDYHFGKGANQSFGTLYPEITTKLDEAAVLSDPAARQKIYDEVNELIKQHAIMVPVAHGGNATVFKNDVEGAHASPLSNEVFAVMKPGDRDQLVWMQNAEPNSLYCGDETDGETLRACEQINEALLGYEVGGTASVPALATECTPNEEFTEWTCKLRDGVKFSDGSTFDAEDVIASLEAQWDASSPNHGGRSGTFDYWTGLFGAFKNAPK